MLLSLIGPLLFSSALFQSDLTLPVTVETQQPHKESHKIHDPTIIKSVPDAVLGYNCVKLARAYRPDLPQIDASQVTVATTTAYVGAVGKMYYPKSSLWHLFYTLKVWNTHILIVDSNYDEGYVTTRVIPRHDPRIEGYL
jgi:hypothetical protein